MSGPDDDDSIESFESKTHPTSFPKESPFGAPLTESDMGELAKTTRQLNKALTGGLDRMGIATQQMSRLANSIGRLDEEKPFKWLSEVEREFEDTQEFLEDFSVDPRPTLPQTILEASSPDRPEQKPQEPSPEEALRVLEDNGVIVYCDGCGHQFLHVNAHRTLTTEDGERLCGRCRDASRDVQ